MRNVKPKPLPKSQQVHKFNSLFSAPLYNKKVNIDLFPILVKVGISLHRNFNPEYQKMVPDSENRTGNQKIMFYTKKFHFKKLTIS